MRLPFGSSFAIAGLVAVSVAAAPDIEAPHARNDVYVSLLREGVTLAGKTITFPMPLLHDGDSPDVERAALRKLAGSDEGVKELLRDSVTAPQILRIHDEKGTDGTIIRVADLWFAVHASLEEIDPGQLGGAREDAKPFEAGNMRFTNHVLTDDELKTRGIVRADPKLEWYTHLAADLLDRIRVEATSRARGSQSKESWVFASRTDHRLDEDAQYPNHWMPVDRQGKAKADAGPKPYPGGASTTKISRLATAPGALLVEGHFAFAEPHAWFDGAPILRSKIALVAQDQIRRLRRELAERRPRPAR
jgi:hypothetical protein